VVRDIIRAEGRQEMSARTIAACWLISVQQILRIGHTGALSMRRNGKAYWVSVSSMEAFLKSRLVA
jgi:hypothetical protein